MGAPAVTGQTPTPAPSRWADWVEPTFPFYSSVVDLRKSGFAFRENNLSPRTLIIKADADVRIAFDLDLLRVAGIWQGGEITARAMAPLSYHDPSKKSAGGQRTLPEPIGTVLVVNGLYPGWQLRSHFSFDDPRPPAPSPEEVGRGALDPSHARFNTLHLRDNQVTLEYVVAKRKIEESFTAQVHAGLVEVTRHLAVEESTTPRLLVLGSLLGNAIPRLEIDVPTSGVELKESHGVWCLHLPAHENPLSLRVVYPLKSPHAVTSASLPKIRDLSRRWPESIPTKATPSPSTGAFVVDDLALPETNPWRRAVRLSDIQFKSDGTAVGLTFDGDVWLIKGLEDPSGEIHWQRYASGLHEPLTLALRHDEIHVFDRNGIWVLRDTDANGEADRHELFSNVFAQTADGREYASSLRLAPDGGFVIAKGGQQSSTLGKHNGSILWISPDGSTCRVLGYGFRQPNATVHPISGMVTSTDQEGEYIPATPLQLVEKGGFYGYLSSFQEREKYPSAIIDPVLWMPPNVCASATSQIWVPEGNLGPLGGSLLIIGFNRPEILQVIGPFDQARSQPAVASVTRDFRFTPLNGAINPKDGNLYLAGFQIYGFGSALPNLAGLGRVRQNHATLSTPVRVEATTQGVLLEFAHELPETTTAHPDAFVLTAWDYRRSYRYGSSQYNRHGQPGHDRLVPSQLYLAQDKRTVFIAVPNIRPAMQLKVSWTLPSEGAGPQKGELHLSPRELSLFDPVKEGYGSISVDLTPRESAANQEESSAEIGASLYTSFGCVGCHASTDESRVMAGPSFVGLYGSPRKVSAGGGTSITRIADEAYLRESILEPGAKTVLGYEHVEVAMPGFGGVLSEAQVESLILFLKSLRSQ